MFASRFTHPRRFGAILPAALALFGLSASAHAQTATYTFEAPVFTAGQTTPLINVAPNSGDAAFRASFTSAPTPNGFSIAVFSPNPLLTGQVLFDPNSPADSLTIAFNTPVTDIGFVFALITNNSTLRATTSNGVVVFNGAPVGGSFQGGTASLSGLSGVTSLNLSAFDAAGAPTLFAIDNLALTAAAPQGVIPEPGTLVLAGTALLPLAGTIRRRKARG